MVIDQRAVRLKDDQVPIGKGVADHPLDRYIESFRLDPVKHRQAIALHPRFDLRDRHNIDIRFIGGMDGHRQDGQEEENDSLKKQRRPLENVIWRCGNLRHRPRNPHG